jgi:hypothetical protein
MAITSRTTRAAVMTIAQSARDPINHLVRAQVANSESDPHNQAQTAKGRNYWRPEFFTFGAVVQVLNKFTWSPL